MKNDELTVLGLGIDASALWIIGIAAGVMLCAVLVERAIESHNARKQYDDLWRELESKKKK